MAPLELPLEREERALLLVFVSTLLVAAASLYAVSDLNSEIHGIRSDVAAGLHEFRVSILFS